MSTKTTAKKFMILLVALLVVSTMLFAACDNTEKFKPVAKPATGEVASNGGVAVKYGEWLYYINGYQSDVDADNAYSPTIRTGAVVRVKLADLEENILGIYALKDKKDDEKKTLVKEAVAKYVEMVVPNFYYTNSTEKDLNGAYLNGLYIFNDRIYITSPNNEPNANGDYQTDQLMLVSYDLGGGDMKTHYVFTSNTATLKLSQPSYLGSDDVYATYILNDQLVCLKLGSKTETVASLEEVSSAKFAGDYVYYLNGDGELCQYKIGQAEATTLVEIEKEEGHEDHNHVTLAIKGASGPYVFYTVTNSESLGEPGQNGKVLYAAKSASEKDIVVSNALPSSDSFYCWYDQANDKLQIIYTAQVDTDTTPAGLSLYNIWKTSGNSIPDDSDPLQEQEKFELLSHDESSSISIIKIENDVLYYSANSIAYTLSLTEADAQPVAYAYNLGTTASGWAYPDVVTYTQEGNVKTFVITAGLDSVSIEKFNPETKKNVYTTKISIYLPDPDAE